MKYKTWTRENGGKYKISDLKIGDRIMIDRGYGPSEKLEPATITSFDNSVDLWTGEPKIGVSVRLLSGEVLAVADYLFEQSKI